MKKIILIIIAFAIGFSINAAETKANYYVMNTGETMTCKKIQFKTNVIIAKMENGSKLIIPVENLKAMRANGKYYEKMPVYVNNNLTSEEKFMQFVTTRAGLKLYKYTTDINKINSSKAFNQQGFETECYVVYKGDQMHVEINENNYQTIFTFFHLPYSEK